MPLAVSYQDLFPTRLWFVDCADLLPHHPGWLADIGAWRTSEPKPEGRSNRLGWNSPTTAFDRPLFAPLRERVGQAFLAAFQDLKLDHPLRFQMEAWANLHDRGAFNTGHVHPHALMSAVYYLQVPEGSGPLVFRDPRPAAVITQLPGRGASIRSEYPVPPRAGMLVVFPHWLEHWVDPHAAAIPRVSIAINARPIELIASG